MSDAANENATEVVVSETGVSPIRKSSSRKNTKGRNMGPLSETSRGVAKSAASCDSQRKNTGARERLGGSHRIAPSRREPNRRAPRRRRRKLRRARNRMTVSA